MWLLGTPDKMPSLFDHDHGYDNEVDMKLEQNLPIANGQHRDTSMMCSTITRCAQRHAQSPWVCCMLRAVTQLRSLTGEDVVHPGRSAAARKGYINQSTRQCYCLDTRCGTAIVSSQRLAPSDCSSGRLGPRTICVCSIFPRRCGSITKIVEIDCTGIQ